MTINDKRYSEKKKNSNQKTENNRKIFDLLIFNSWQQVCFGWLQFFIQFQNSGENNLWENEKMFLNNFSLPLSRKKIKIP